MPSHEQEPLRLSLKITLRSGGRLGPGKIALLEAIDSLGSISAAGRHFSMSYRRAWELVEDLNRAVGRDVVSTSAGGSRGGGARLTEIGRGVVDAYRSGEKAALVAAKAHLDRLDQLARPER